MPEERHYARMMPVAQKSILVALVLLATLIVIVTALWYQITDVSQLAGLVHAAQAIANEHIVLAIVLYGLWCFTLQLTVLPVGSATIFLAYFLLGPVLAISVYIVAMIAAIPPIYLLVNTTIRESVGAFAERSVGGAYPALTALPAELRREGVLTSMALRLMPIFPSGVATGLAASLGISQKQYVLGTLLSAWIRPTLIITTALGLETITEAVYHPAGWAEGRHLPLLFGFAGAALLALAARAWVRRRIAHSRGKGR